MSQNPPAKYDQVFQQTIIPKTAVGQKYPHAETTVFSTTANNLKEEIIIIDSRYRDWDHETQSNYTYYLGQQFEYVQSLELVDGAVLSSNYVINPNNNVLVFVEGGEITMTIPVGVYTIDSLCAQIGSLMSSASLHGYTYTCVHDPLTDLVTISASADHPFDLLWSRGTEIIEDGSTVDSATIDPVTHRRVIQRVNTGRSRSVGPILGFLPFNQTRSHSYTAQQVYNLYPNQYLSLYVTNGTNEDCKNVYAQTNMVGVNGAFAILNLAQEFVRPYGIHNSQYTARRRFTRFFNPPIKINRLKIEIKTPDGDYYDFHGLDHYLMLIIQRIYNREIVGPVNRLY